MNQGWIYFSSLWNIQTVEEPSDTRQLSGTFQRFNDSTNSRRITGWLANVSPGWKGYIAGLWFLKIVKIL